jgi:crotonobetainyl-CoA:carnitine CoA-transferase CaiB-like acyl-CoA transferase
MAAFSITIALYEREITGEGQMVDISMMSSIMFAGSAGLIEFEGNIRIPFTNPQGSIPLYKFYQAKDGEWFFLGLGNFTFFTKFALLMGHEEWLIDPLFEGAPFLIMPPRNERVIDMLKEIFLTRTRDEWIELLRSKDIPCAPAQPVEVFLNDPQVIANEMVVELYQPGVGMVREMGIPVKLTLNPGKIKGPAPSLGEHTEEVFSEILGYSHKEIEELRSKGVI